MSTQILYQEQARTNLIKGIKIIARAVSITLGPLGYNVLLHKSFSTPEIISDGFTIVKEIELKNPTENTGIKLIRQAASKTNDVVGDGTTTTIIIAYNLIHYGIDHIIAGSNVIDLITGIKKAVEFLIHKIAEYAQPVHDIKTITQIATIASGNNPKIADVITSIIQQIGTEGIISLEESSSINTTVEIVKDITLDKGLFSPLFIKKEGNVKIIQENPYILITDKKITSVQQQLVPILELVGKTSRPLLILAEDLSAEVLSTLVINHLQGVISVIAVRTPGFGNQRKQLLEDISTITQSSIINEERGLRLDNIQLSMLGEARKVIVDHNSTTIILHNKQQQIELLCNQLRKQINISNTIYEKDSLKNRLARISGKAAIIKIGALTEIELQNKKLRFKEALKSIQASVEEGTLPGGGSIYIHLALELSSWAQKYLNKDELMGALLVKKSLTTPSEKIIKNAGHNQAIVLEKLKNYNFTTGYNTISGQFVNMYQEGIIDSAKVIRLILQNAASIAKMFLTTECLIINKFNQNS